MTVINGDGLVGRVKTVDPSTATVLLAIDPESTVGARLEGTLRARATSRRRDRPAAAPTRCSTRSQVMAPGDRW